MSDGLQASRPALRLVAERWLHALFPFPGSPGVLERFSDQWRAHGCPPEMALFARTTAGYGRQVYLLTPAAAALAANLPGRWLDAGDPTEMGWSLQVGRCDARPLFGLGHEMLKGRAS